MALKVGELYALFTLDQSGVDSAITSIEQKLNKMSTTFTRTGTLLTNALTRPILDFGKDASKTAMSYGAEMSKSMSRFGFDTETPEGLAEFAEAYEAIDTEVMRVAKDSVYTTSEVAGAVEKMAMAGWSWEASVAAIEPMMDLAAASGEDVVTVSDIVTDAMTAFGLTFEKAGGDIDTFNGYVTHFSNVLAAAATSSNTDIGMMGESFKYAASMAGAMGYSVDDVAMALGLMANRGVKASQGGTALRRMFTNMLNPKGDAKDVVEKLNLTLVDTQGNMLSMADVMDQLRERFSDMPISLDAYAAALVNAQDAHNFNDWIDRYDEFSDKLTDLEKKGDTSGIEALKQEYADVIALWDAYEADADEILADLRENNDGAFDIISNAVSLGGARGMQALLAIITASDEEYQALRAAIEGSDTYGNGKGRTHAMKETMLDNAQGSLTKFTSSVDVLKTQIGDLINQSLVPMIDSAKEIVDRFIEMDDETKANVMQVIGLVASIGPALVGIGALTALLPKLASAFSFLTSPVGIIIALFGALAFSAMDAEGDITKGMQGIADALGLDTSGMNLEGFDLNETLNGMMDSAVNFANSPVVTNFMDKLGEGIRGAVDKIGSLDGAALVQTLIGTITGLANSEGVQKFMQNLGEGFKGAMSSLGNVTGEMISYIFSVQGLTDILHAGVALGKLLIQGVVNGVTGVGNFVKNMIENVLIGWGVLSEEEVQAAKEAGEQLAAVTETALEDKDIDPSMELLLNWGNWYGGQNLKDLDAAVQDTVSGFNSALKGALSQNTGSGEEFRDAALSSLFWSNEDWLTQAIEKGVNLDDPNLNIAEVLKNALGFDLNEILPNFDNIEFWDNLKTALESGKQSEVMKVITDAMTQVGEEASETAEQAGEKVAPEVLDTLSEVGLAYNETADAVTAGADNIVDAMGNGASKMSDAAFSGTLQAEKGDAETAAMQLSDAVVQQFLAEMSVENGTALAESFLSGILSVLNDTARLTTPASALGNAVRIAVTAAMSWLTGYNIGRNFGTGLLNGINSMLQAVTDAASNLGASAAGALSTSIDEGSPSRVTEETGENFGLGFINAIWDSMTGAANAAVTMGRTAAGALRDGVGSISASAADQLSVTAGTRTSEADKLAAENEKTASTYAAAIANALSGARVVMNGETVGQLVTDTVSEEIASRYVGKRYGTV